ncbi:MAG: family 10 glycosylhydrolase [Ruminococcus sp.]|nr:family 10 glycosylhydrolase [Ruminococcus sp.]
MKKIIIFALMLACTSCGVSENKPVPYVQEFEHLHIDGNYKPVNYDNQVGMWFPYMHFEEYMYNKNADTFREAVREKFESAVNQGINTVYLHVHPCGDAYYVSDIFPTGVYLNNDYDPLQIMIEEAHNINLSVHAWLNPLRCQTVEQMYNLPENFLIKQWADNPECHFVEVVNGRYYLNPAYDEVINLICDCAEEIIENYDVDGIHIDDYFYPTTDESFDYTAFASSDSDNLSAWRMENCTKLVKSLYDTVNKHGLVFGISPQGNISANYSTQYADVNLWGSEDGYCDYIVPQIYFGFNNETCPFVPTLEEWEEIVSGSDVRLIIGLGAYKLGQADKWAGIAGENEWLENPDIINQQIETVNNSTADGYALYY